jgi:hypothetical protein
MCISDWYALRNKVCYLASIIICQQLDSNTELLNQNANKQQITEK